MALIGLDRLRARFKRIPVEVRSSLVQAIRVSALDLDRTMKQSIQKGPKTGRLYRRGSRKGRPRFHRASAPGQPPATDTGRLVSSIAPRFFDGGLVATVGVQEVARVRYARFLEFGTRRMRPRPFVRPAFTLKKGAIEERLRRAVQNGLRGRSAV